MEQSEYSSVTHEHTYAHTTTVNHNSEASCFPPFPLHTLTPTYSHILTLNLMVISKSIERIADHAKNIAELAVYLCDAQDIRHHSRPDAPSRYGTARDS